MKATSRILVVQFSKCAKGRVGGEPEKLWQTEEGEVERSTSPGLAILFIQKGSFSTLGALLFLLLGPIERAMRVRAIVVRPPARPIVPHGLARERGLRPGPPAGRGGGRTRYWRKGWRGGRCWEGEGKRVGEGRRGSRMRRRALAQRVVGQVVAGHEVRGECGGDGGHGDKGEAEEGRREGGRPDEGGRGQKQTLMLSGEIPLPCRVWGRP